MCSLIPDHGKYYDLNVICDDKTFSLSKRLSMLVYLGYEAAALSCFLDASKQSGKGKKKNYIPPPPEKIELDENSLKTLKSRNAVFTQLTRITVELSDIEDLSKLRTVLLSGSYDLVAVLPRTEKLFHTCCTELNVDIICIDGTDKLAFTPRHNPIKSAISRGIYFEVWYSPMIRSTTVRRLTITNVQKFVEFSKGKNLILSSGALSPMELRAPYDVANIASLFTVPKEVSIHTVSKNCRSAIVHSFARKTAKSAVCVIKSEVDGKEKQDNETPSKKLKLQV